MFILLNVEERKRVFIFPNTDSLFIKYINIYSLCFKNVHGFLFYVDVFPLKTEGWDAQNILLKG